MGGGLRDHRGGGSTASDLWRVVTSENASIDGPSALGALTGLLLAPVACSSLSPLFQLLSFLLLPLGHHRLQSIFSFFYGFASCDLRCVPEKKVDVNDPEFWTKCVGLTVPVEKEEQLGRYAIDEGRKTLFSCRCCLRLSPLFRFPI